MKIPLNLIRFISGMDKSIEVFLTDASDDIINKAISDATSYSCYDVRDVIKIIEKNGYYIKEVDVKEYDV